MAATAGLKALPVTLATTNTFITPLNDLTEPHALINKVIKTNRTHATLDPFREIAAQEGSSYKLSKGVLMWKGRLIVPAVGFLRTYLIRAIHATQVTAHPSRRKTGK